MEEKVNTNHRLTFVGLVLSLLVSLNVLAAPAEKEWSMLVYVNGINSLDSYGKMNINQMEAIGSTNDVNVVVEWGSMSRKDVQRLLVKKDNDTRNVTSPVVQSLGDVDMGDWHELVNFVDWAHQNYPAKHYFIAVWNHGGGWHFVNEKMKPMDISWDDRSGNVITTEQLGQAMGQISQIIGHKVDIYGSDACLMGMVEVATEMQNSVDYFVGSQDLEPGQGWPYTPFLQKWTASASSMTPAAVATLLSKEYTAAYSGGVYGHSSVTMSVLDMSKLDGYKTALANLAKELNSLSSSNFSKVKKAASNAKYFEGYDYRDILDFVNKINQSSVTLSSSPALAAAQQSLVISNDQNQDKQTWGLSVWLPSDSYDYDDYVGRYQNLKFNQDTNWLSLVKNIVGE